MSGSESSPVRSTHPSPDFQVDGWTHFLGGLIERRKPLWIRLGNLETRVLSGELADVAVDTPVYVTGVARSGSTVLLEFLSAHPQAVTHRYRDFPMLFTPYAWNRFLDRVPLRRQAPVERSHRDGLRVTRESPEAFEEALWMAFFPGLHDPARSAVLDAATRHPRFESFYRAHVRKLLLLRGGSRYVSKANYHITRLAYLLRLFPDARFVIPVRDPVWHIASLMKQQRLLCQGQQGNPRALTHLRRVGHFEFGMDRRPINAGDTASVAEIVALWERGEEVEGWARYWSHIHDHLAHILDDDPQVRAACRIVHFEALCSQPRETIESVLAHCRLPPSEALLQRAQQRARFPAYYRPAFTRRELDLIHRHTGDAAARLGMNGAAAAGARAASA